MSVKTPIRTVFDGEGNATGLAELQSGEFIGLTHGGLGASLSIGSSGQILKVNSGGTALEFGNVEAVVNIDGATDLTGSTLVAGDQILLSDNGTEGRVTLSQIDTLFKDTTQTLTNKTISSASNTITITESNISDLQSYILADSTDTLTNKSISLTSNTLSGTTAEFNSALSDGSFTTLAGTETLTNKTINSSNNTITISGSEATLSNIANASLSNSSITVTDGSTSTATALGGTITIQGTSNEVEVGESSGTFTVGLPDDVTVGGALTVTGNLTVNGTTTTVNSTNTTLDDNLLELNSGAASNANDSGIIIERGSTGDNAIMAWDESADKFIVGTTTATASDTGNLVITTGTMVANIEGNVTGNVTGDVTGNADTATALETARNIGGVSFDGTANINLPGVNTTGNQDTSGNAATATALETARNIAGQSFDGTGNISIAPTDLTGVTASAAEINILDGATLSTTELNYVDGVTSAIQTQIDTKAATTFAVAFAVAFS